MTLPRFTIADACAALLILVFIVLLGTLPVMLSQQEFDFAFSEEGPFERLSIVAWLMLSMLILLRIRPLGLRAAAFSLLTLLFAAREAEWHKAFTADSILKTNYYRHTIAPFEEKLAAGIVAVAAIALLLYIGVIIARFLFLQGGWRSRSGFWLLLGTFLVVAGKLLDRAPAVLLEDYGIALMATTQLYTAAFEEGLEMLHPLILGWSVWISQNERRYLS